jgi:trehalose 6-phosphate synthase/phosphatase
MYGQLRREVDELVGKVNGEFSSADWMPIIYLRRGIPKTELVALYAAAEVAWVSPLRDGLNLVAKEYIACHESGDGALVLSEFAGAAAEMGEALLINPFDEDRTAEVVMQALSLPEAQKKDRMRALARRVARNNVFAWGDRFVTNLAEAARARAERAYGEPTRVPISELVAEFSSSRRRLLMLDYDGTLAPFSGRPQDASPGQELLAVLDRLAAVEATTVAIISGRARGEIEEWFRQVPRLWLAAEHGAAIRAPGSHDWELRSGRYSSESRHRVLTVLEHFVDRTPGSFIEEKEFSLVWHYRMSDPEFGEWLANELVSNLGQMLADTEWRAVHGNRMVEVRPIWANKGQVSELLLARERSEHPGDDVGSFVLAAGDDRTDEDMFAELPSHAWSIHVGTGRSRARFRVAGPTQMVAVLEGLAVSYAASRVTAATRD